MSMTALGNSVLKSEKTILSRISLLFCMEFCDRFLESVFSFFDAPNSCLPLHNCSSMHKDLYLRSRPLIKDSDCLQHRGGRAQFTHQTPPTNQLYCVAGTAVGI
jgi:hypothetical protein